jgi:hypothetical protein
MKNNIKINFYKYVLFVYKYYIQEDWTIYTKIGKFFIKPFWFIKMIISIIYSVICFPLVLLHMILIKHKKIILIFFSMQNKYFLNIKK